MRVVWPRCPDKWEYTVNTSSVRFGLTMWSALQLRLCSSSPVTRLTPRPAEREKACSHPMLPSVALSTSVQVWMWQRWDCWRLLGVMSTSPPPTMNIQHLCSFVCLLAFLCGFYHTCYVFKVDLDHLMIFWPLAEDWNYRLMYLHAWMTKDTLNGDDCMRKDLTAF